jgi:hypothetical protein
VIVTVLVDRHPRSKRLSEALAAGAARIGWRAEITDEQHIVPRGDLCVAYGWLPNRDTMAAYRAAGAQYLHVDLGYWERKRREGDYGGNHKVVLNARHPVAYFRCQRPATRVDGGHRSRTARSYTAPSPPGGTLARSMERSGHRPSRL